MSAIEATIQITVDWLLKHEPVVFTNRSKCTHCGVPKKGHVCRKVTQPKKRKGSSARAAVKRMRK